MEWGPAFTLPVKDLNLKKSDWIDIAVNIYCVDSIPPEVILVASLKSGQKQMYWNGADLRNFWLKPGWNRLILNLSIIDLPFIRKDQVFTTYIWNKGLRNIFIDDYEIAVKEGNPRIYGFYYNMEK